MSKYDMETGFLSYPAVPLAAGILFHQDFSETVKGAVVLYSRFMYMICTV